MTKNELAGRYEHVSGKNGTDGRVAEWTKNVLNVTTDIVAYRNLPPYNKDFFICVF